MRLLNRRSAILTGGVGLMVGGMASRAMADAFSSTAPGVQKSFVREKQNPYMIACRQRPVPDAIVNDTTNNSLNSRMVCFAPTACSVSDIMLGFPGFGLNNPEADLPNATFTVTASVEYPIGTFNPVYSNGSRTLTVNAGRRISYFDPCPIVIPAGAKFYVKVFAQWTVGSFWLTDKTAVYSSGEWTIRGTSLTDQTLTTTTQTSTSTSGYGPLVYGRLGRPAAVLAIVGDSISMSAVDQPDPVTGSQWLEAAMLGQIPVINMARSSDGGNYYTARNEGRNLIMRDAVTHVLYAYGRNDLSSTPGAGITLNQAYLQNITGLWLNQGKSVGAVTITPYTTTTDNWATIANQTVYPDAIREGNRVAYNAWLRANWQSLGLSYLLDWAHVVDPTDSGKWNVDGVAGNNAAGFATMSGGSVASVAFGNYNVANSTGSGYPATSNCYVYAYPGDPGSGAAVTANSSNSNNVDSYTVTAGGSGYLHAPMIAPVSRWTNDGIHPNHRGYIEIIKQTGFGPSMIVL